jgi:hypothetical protein
MEDSMNARLILARIASTAAASVALALAAPGASAQAPDVFITVFAGHFVAGGKSYDDLDALEVAVRAQRPGAVRLYACGSGTARAQMAAAHRFRQNYLELRVLDAADPPCRTSSAAAAQAMTVAQRTGTPPYGIDEVAVAQWWYAMMP